MSGKLCDGSTNNPTGKESKAFCEGRAARAAAAVPVNPHPTGSADGLAWARGVTSKASAEPDGCCGPTGAAAT